MIIIEPIGGLCNRLRAMDSAIAVSEKIRKPLHVVWVCNSEINCKFSDLFNKPEKIKSLTEPKIRSRIIRFSLAQMVGIYFSRFNNCYLKDIVDLSNNTGLFEKILNSKKIYIRADSQFYPAATPFTHFIPKAFLQEEIDHYKHENMIGVHIRRSDNVKSTIHSPLKKFIEHMNKEIERDNDVMFFVATDEPQVEFRLRKIFKDKIIIHNKRSLDRNTPLAIQDAVIDLFCLANCRKLIGSYWSSYTNVAWQINQIENIIIHDAV